MKPKHLILILIAVLVLGGLAWWGTAHRSIQIKLEDQTYTSKTECEEKSKLSCEFIICTVQGPCNGWHPYKKTAVNNLPTPSDQASWKTYHNEKFGFEFDYPANYELILHSAMNTSDYWGIRKISNSKDKQNPDEIRLDISLDLRIQSFEDLQISLDAFCRDNKCITNSFDKFINKKGVSGRAFRAIVQSGQSAFSDYFLHNGWLYRFTVYNPYGLEEFLSQITNTLRFTNP